MRQVVLDTETTGLEWTQDHRIIEIGCVELVNRRLTGHSFHRYVNPEREIDAGAMEVHGITQEDLEDKPTFSSVVDEFLAFVKGAELIIHNAPFDLGFINHEFTRIQRTELVFGTDYPVIDTLVLARQLHPGQRNSLDALCKRYGVDNTQRTLHGALLDAEILADVYLLMTGGQTNLILGDENRHPDGDQSGEEISGMTPVRAGPLKIVRASPREMALHQEKIAELEAKTGRPIAWPEPVHND